MRISKYPPRADNEVEQINADIETSTEGRSIGGARDKSAPTGVRIILLKAIIGGARDYYLITCPPDRVPGEGAGPTVIPNRPLRAG
ncbi:MAG: hypothetical protein ACJ788_25795 [Ktedonobacteraceae bacterium]